MKQLFTFLCLVVVTGLFAQAPQSIPYQAVVRNTDGSVMADAAMTITFKIHDASATGNVVYEENHAATTNSQGLISLNVGNGVVVSGTFSGINWGAGGKFLHVLMNTGSGVVDLGTQQMMSVPYALYAEKANTTNVSVSAVGDTLYLGNGNFILVPGISNSNKTVDTGLGNVLLPGVYYCSDKTISASGCDGMTTLDYQGYTYDLVEIAGQCWFKENLRAIAFNDGTPITFEPNNDIWWSSQPSISHQPYYAYCNNNPLSLATYGCFYNGWCLENDNICPVGWHIPTVCDTYYLFSSLGVSNSELDATSSELGLNSLLGQKLISNEQGLWLPSALSFLPTNSSGLSIIPGGGRSTTDGENGSGSTFWFLNNYNEGYEAITPWLLNTTNTVKVYFVSQPDFTNTNSNYALNYGRYIRCIKD